MGGGRTLLGAVGRWPDGMPIPREAGRIIGIRATQPFWVLSQRLMRILEPNAEPWYSRHDPDRVDEEVDLRRDALDEQRGVERLAAKALVLDDRANLRSVRSLEPDLQPRDPGCRGLDCPRSASSARAS